MKKKLLMMGITGLSLLCATKGFSQVPTASFTIDQPTTCVNSVINITDVSSDSPTSWSYTVQGTGAPVTTQNPALNFGAPGNYSITLIATNANGDSAPFSQTVTINALPSVTASASSTLVCAGGTVALTGSGATTYTWTGGVADGVAFAPSGNQTYSLVGTDANGCSNAVTAIVTVSVNALPTLTITGDAGACSGAMITETVTGADTYSWSTSSTMDNISDSPTSSTVYTVTGTSALTGCSASKTVSVTIENAPTIAISDATICAGDVFTMNPTGAATYTFSNGSNTVSPMTTDSFVITGSSALGCTAPTSSAVINITVNSLPTVAVTGGTLCGGTSFVLMPTGAVNYTYSGGSATVSPAANQSYTVTGADINGCTATAIADLTVTAAPVLTVSGTTSICVGATVTETVTGADTYTWDGGSNADNISDNPTANVTYTVTGTNTLTGCSASTTQIVMVDAFPVITVTDAAICAGDVFTITASGAATYTYSSGSNTVSPAADDSYTVTGSSPLGCTAPTSSAVINVTVNAQPTITATGGIICSGGVFTLSPSGAATYTYSGGSNTVSPASDDSYTITGADANGCIATAVVDVTVNPTPTVTVNSGSICSGSVFTIVPTGAVNYTYTGGSNTVSPASSTDYSVTGADANGCLSGVAVSNVIVNATPTITATDGTLCAGFAFTITPSGATSYTYSGGSNTVMPMSDATYTVTGADASGCAGTTTVNINVSPAPTITAVSGSICAGGVFSITATGATSYTYVSTSTLILPSNTVMPASSETYTVLGLGADGCFGFGFSSVTVNALPVVNIALASNTICVGEIGMLTASGASSYSWSSGESTATINVTPLNTSTFAVTGTDANGCVSTASATENVDPCLGIAAHSNDIQVGVYPNPNNGTFTIKVAKTTSIAIVSIVGKTVYTAQLNEGENVVSLNDQANGVYFIQLKQDNTAKTMKVVKN